MMKTPILSLCLPTNGISEWVFPVLDSVYSQNIDMNLFEVIVTDNGHNNEFASLIEKYKVDKSNLLYKKTNAFLFENQIEALRLANGTFLKFLNHRSVLSEGSLKWMIDYILANQVEKPVLYFSNGALKLKQPLITNSFDMFVRGLREFASWTTGVGVWKTDFEKIPVDKVYNKISPHSDVLFSEREKGKYIIEDSVWSHEIDNSHKKKGQYDLYKAFGIEELSVTLSLYLDGDISIDTLKYVKKCYESLLVHFYREFTIMKKECSYSLESFDKCTSVFFSPAKIRLRAYLSLVSLFLRKIFRMS